MSTDVETLKAFYAALNRGDVTAVLRHCDPQIVRVEPEGFLSGRTYRGLAELRDHVAAGRGTWAEGGCEPERFWSRADKVVVDVHVRVRLKDAVDWLEGRVADAYAFRDGLITEFISFPSRADAFAWAGIADDAPAR